MSLAICIRCFKLGMTTAEGSVCSNCIVQSAAIHPITRTIYRDNEHDLQHLLNTLDRTIGIIQRKYSPQCLVKIGIPYRRDAFGWASIKDIQAVISGQLYLNQIDPNLIILPILLPRGIIDTSVINLFEFRSADFYEIDGLYIPGTYRINVSLSHAPDKDFIAKTPLRDERFDEEPFRVASKTPDDEHICMRDRYIQAVIHECIRLHKPILSICAGTWRHGIALGADLTPLSQSLRQRHMCALSGQPDAHTVHFMPKSLGATFLRTSRCATGIHSHVESTNLDPILGFDLAFAKAREESVQTGIMDVNSIHWFAVNKTADRCVGILNDASFGDMRGRALVSGVSPDDDVTEFFETSDIAPGSGRVCPRLASQFHVESFLQGMIDYHVASNPQKKFAGNLFAYFLYSAHKWRYSRRGNFLTANLSER